MYQEIYHNFTAEVEIRGCIQTVEAQAVFILKDNNTYFDSIYDVRIVYKYKKTNAPIRNSIGVDYVEEVERAMFILDGKDVKLAQFEKDIKEKLKPLAIRSYENESGCEVV
jgi:hypothetical protein